MNTTQTADFQVIHHVPSAQPDLSQKGPISWDALEYIKHQKGPKWFVGAAIIIGLIVVWGILTGGWTMSLAFLAFAAVYYLHHQREPQIIRINLSEMGINIANRSYPYSKIKYFWIVYNPPFVKTLHIRLSNGTINELEIQLDGQDPASVRNYLLQQIPEMEGKDESLTSIFTRLTKL